MHIVRNTATAALSSDQPTRIPNYEVKQRCSCFAPSRVAHLSRRTDCARDASRQSLLCARIIFFSARFICKMPNMQRSHNVMAAGFPLKSLQEEFRCHAVSRWLCLPPLADSSSTSSGSRPRKTASSSARQVHVEIENVQNDKR